MSTRIRCVVALLAMASLGAGVISAQPRRLPEGYDYPYRDPYLATVTVAVLNANSPIPGFTRQVVHVPVLPGRNGLPSLEGRGSVSVALYRQRHPAPLLFVLPGIGSNPYFGLSTYLARLFHQEGFHVVILPSPMNWNFALAASRSGAPGHAPEDARDLYAAMQNILGVLSTTYDVKITGLHFLGVSLGALEGAYLSVIDAEERKIGIEKYLLVNPPLDLSYALKKLDEWAALRGELGKDRADRLRARAEAIIEPYAKDMRDDPATIDQLAQQLSRFTTQELQLLIAGYVHTVLPELVYVTQVVNDQQVLSAAKDQPRRRLQEAKGLTLMDYGEKIGMPLWRRQTADPHTDLEDLSRRGSLAPILDRLRANPKVHIMHNADDVLADRASIEELKDAMGDRMTLYPTGGHLGNLWYRQNKEDILRQFGISGWVEARLAPGARHRF